MYKIDGPWICGDGAPSWLVVNPKGEACAIFESVTEAQKWIDKQ